MYNKQQLKPLTHKKTSNNLEAATKPTLSKEIKQETKKQSDAVKPALAKKSSNGETGKAVKYERSGQRSTKTIEHYDCDDFGL